MSKSIERQKLGQTPLEISTIGLGCMGLSEFYGAAAARPLDERQAISVIHRALELGINFFDTADMYGPFKNEELLGRALRGRRAAAVIATKFAVQRGLDGAYLGISGRPEYVRAACDASLKRLGTEVIDLYYQHRVDPETPIEDSVGAMSDLVRLGKVRYLGLSEASPATLRRAHAVHPISALQTEYSLWSREPEGGILSTCQELGVSFVAYSPLGRGFLSGKIRSADDLAEGDWRRSAPRFQPENLSRNLTIVDKLADLAQRKNCSLAQMALAWVLTRGTQIVAIPGTTKIERLEENVRATEIDLTAADLAEIEAIAPKGAASGLRYTEAALARLNL